MSYFSVFIQPYSLLEPLNFKDWMFILTELYDFKE